MKIIRGDERGSKLYLPADMDPEAYRPKEPVTWLEGVAAAFADAWRERLGEAERARRRPHPLSTGAVRARVAESGRWDERLADPQLLVNAMAQLARTEAPVIRRIERDGQRQVLWAPVGTPDEDLDIGSAYATDSERVGEAAARAEVRLGCPVRLEDIRYEIEQDDALRPAGNQRLNAIVSELAKERIDAGDGERCERGLRRLRKLGLVRNQAYYAVSRIAEGEAYVALADAEEAWKALGFDAERAAIERCDLPTVAIGRARRIVSEARAIRVRLAGVADGEHRDAKTRRQARELADEINGAVAPVEEWVAAEAPRYPDLPDEVDTGVPGWTAGELLEALQPFYPKAREVEEARKLIPMMERAIRRVPNPGFVSRRSGDPRTAAEKLFDRTDALCQMAFRWGGPESRLHATVAAQELGPLRDARFVLPALEDRGAERRITAVACLAYLGPQGAAVHFHRLARRDVDAGARRSASWAAAFTRGDETAWAE